MVCFRRRILSYWCFFQHSTDNWGTPEPPPNPHLNLTQTFFEQLGTPEPPLNPPRTPTSIWIKLFDNSKVHPTSQLSFCIMAVGCKNVLGCREWFDNTYGTSFIFNDYFSSIVRTQKSTKWGAPQSRARTKRSKKSKNTASKSKKSVVSAKSNGDEGPKKDSF